MVRMSYFIFLSVQEVIICIFFCNFVTAKPWRQQRGMAKLRHFYHGILYSRQMNVPTINLDCSHESGVEWKEKNKLQNAVCMYSIK